ncbi:unnamed protein product [Rotaria socialis]
MFFTSYNRFIEYDSQVVPLLRRMIHLEQLTLYLSVINRSTFIDGIHPKDNILDRMPQLQTFSFNIITRTNVSTSVHNQLYKHMRCTFLNGKFHQVDFYLDHYSDGMARSHIYLLPYKMNDMHDISNTFPGGSFTNVRVILLFDIHYPFEYKIYDRIARSFPFLTDLTVLNRKPRNYKSSHEAKKSDQIASVIVFPHLTHLRICLGNMDIAEQLLVNTNTLLPSHVAQTDRKPSVNRGYLSHFSDFTA